MRVGLVGQKANGRAAGIVADLRDRLSERGIAVVIDEATASALNGSRNSHAAGSEGAPVSAMADCDLVVSIGGDGTFLYAARGAKATPIMGVNLGEVGFLNAVAPSEAVETVLAEVDRFHEDGHVRARELPRLRARGDGWSIRPALNEIVVQGPQRGRGGGVTVEVRVDGDEYTSGHADGVLVATPTGSTAYNLSEGGPLVHPAVGGLVVTKLCATESMPPLVVGLDSEVHIQVADADHAAVVGDGRAKTELDVPATIRIGRAEDPVAVAGPPLDFFTALGKLD